MVFASTSDSIVHTHGTLVLHELRFQNDETNCGFKYEI